MTIDKNGRQINTSGYFMSATVSDVDAKREEDIQHLGSAKS